MSLPVTPGGRKAETTTLGIAGGVVLVLALLLAWIWVQRHPSRPVPQDFSLTWDLAPVWPAPAAAALRPRPAAAVPGRCPGDLAIYFDVSQPLGGFLDPGAAAVGSDYQFLFNQIPDELFAKAGSSRSRFCWWTVASELAASPPPHPLRRTFFCGKDSRLDLAVADMLQGFAAGRLRAAALVTDLISTGDLTGALGVARALSDWMSSNAVRSGSFHAGLLGVKARYWGIVKPHCAARAGTSCWFSEQAQAWRPLPAPANVPFYVLLLGRDAGEVQAIGEHLRESAGRRHVEARWELLSDVVRPRRAVERCRLATPGQAGEQFTLVRGAGGEFSCHRGEEVEIICGVPAGARLSEPRLEASWPGVRAELRGGQAVVTLDCAALRREVPAGDLVLKLTGAPGPDAAKGWEGWSTETDTSIEDLGKTLQLDSFLARVRPKPASLQLASGALLQGRPRRPRAEPAPR